MITQINWFWIKDTQQITIQTNVQWGHTKIHIDETFNKTSAPKYKVVGSKAEVPITLSKEAKASLLSKLKPGTSLISELAPYKNCLVVVKDDNDRIGIRQGNYAQSGWARTDFFYVEEHGRRNQWVGLEPGKTDVSLNARYGFYNFNVVYDVMLENVRLVPYEQDRGDPNRNVSMGKYGIGGGTVLCSVFRNVTAEGSNVHWGVFGTNMYKNFYVESCRLNRIDVHFHGWNLYFRDCENKRLTLTGGGDLFIENTKCYSNTFLNLRNDYGAKWDGDIRITNCRLIVTNGDQEAKILETIPIDFDYKYPVGHGRSIRIEDFVFDYSGFPSGIGTCWIMKLAAFSKNKFGQRLFFPSLVEFSNVKVEGREKGVRIVEIKEASGYVLRDKGGYDGQMLMPNCRMRFESIQLEKVPEQSPKSTKHVHFWLNASSGGTPTDEYGLYPAIELSIAAISSDMLTAWRPKSNLNDACLTA